MNFELLGGGRIAATTDQELIEALRQDGMAWAPTVGPEDFMEGMASRCKMQKGVTISTDTQHAFLHGLQEHGFLTPIDVWRWIGADAIQSVLLTLWVSEWNHQLLWSSARPLLLSKTPAGKRVATELDNSLLSVPGYLTQLAQRHVQQIRQQQ